MPTQDPVATRTYRTINRPLTILGVERRLFFLAVGTGTATFNLFNSLGGGLAMTAVLFGFGLWATASDPALLSILLVSVRHARFYDPLKRSAGRVRP